MDDGNRTTNTAYALDRTTNTADALDRKTDTNTGDRKINADTDTEIGKLLQMKGAGKAGAG